MTFPIIRAENREQKSMSEFVRDIITEKMKIEEIILSTQMAEPIEIPDYVPQNLYVIFVKGAVVAIGPNPSDLADIAIQKFPNLPFIIKYNGPKQKSMEYCYANIHGFQGRKYSIFEDHS
jgi:hypothetical protein